MNAFQFNPQMFDRIKQGFSGLSTVVIDATTLKTKVIRKVQFTIGYGTVNTWNLNTNGPPSTILTCNRTSDGLDVEPTNPGHAFVVNGRASLGECLAYGAVHTLQVADEFFLLFVTKQPNVWLKGINLNEWMVFEFSTGAVHGPFNRTELQTWVRENEKNPSKLKYVPKGLHTGFNVDQILGMELPHPVTQKTEPQKGKVKQQDGASRQEVVDHREEVYKPPVRPRDDSTPQSRCPHCWSTLYRDELLNVAVHESLRGDPLLGPDEMLRFRAKSFNQQNFPLDATGTPCLEHACPHCRLKVIPGLFGLPQAFISIFGSPGAGKSYFLSVLTNELKNTALEKWGLGWEDPDPTGNAPLNSMRHRIFSAEFSRDAYLAKTSLDGHLYSKANLNGRATQLPRPFTYILEGADGQAQTLTFYDNAGEQFQPDMDGITNPVTHHLAHSHLWCFLFDPSKDATFRKLLKGSKDPQLSRRYPMENQELLLSELKNRVRTLHQLPQLGKLNTPLAFIIGKMDMLEEWEPVTRLADPWNGNVFNPLIVEENSRILREGLRQLVPGIVSQAESLSEKVVYFASTTFGHPPRPLEAGLLSPLPKRIKAKGVEVPIFWWLNSWSSVFVNNEAKQEQES